MPPSKVESLFSKLNSHWTPIAHHLYLKHECPSPLPRVGPLAELLGVTRKVCTEFNTLVVNGDVTPADAAAGGKSSGQQKPILRLLGKLVSWLHSAPQEETLINTETQETLWQLLLVTLANMLRVVNKDPTVTAALQQELVASGMPLLCGTEQGMLSHCHRPQTTYCMHAYPKLLACWAAAASVSAAGVTALGTAMQQSVESCRSNMRMHQT